MDWINLFSPNRLGRDEPYDTRGRSPFQRDYDRIIFSSAFRRLQDKTQVFPLAHVDYVRTRLTHSLEVSCVGRSLGLSVGEVIETRYSDLPVNSTHFGEVIAAACLGHDIGNPPFGHSGEESIRHWFRESEVGKRVLENLDPMQREDFLQFEGNAQGFRILSKLQYPTSQGGLQLSYATLGAFCKYPRPSILDSSSQMRGISTKKHGYFASEIPVFEKIARVLGLSSNGSNTYHRHPLAFLVEAADDICYHFIDFGDGFRLGYVSYSEVEDLLMSIFGDERDRIYKRIQLFHEDKDRLEYLAGKAISLLISQVAEVFLAVESEIREGQFDQELISEVASFQVLEKIKSLSIQKVYGAREVLEIEAAGFEVLGGLLDLIVPAVEDASRAGGGNSKSRKLLELIPNQFLNWDGTPSVDNYERILKITDFISGMTDSYAIKFHGKISGRILAGGRGGW